MSSEFEQWVSATDYLRRAATTDIGRTYKALALAQLGLRPGARLLDLGCGPGADLAAYAHAVGVEGLVVGVDHDPEAVETARRCTAHLPQVSILHADAHHLPLTPRTFDAVHTDRVLQHLHHPADVLTQLAGMLRDGGTAVLAEPD